MSETTAVGLTGEPEDDPSSEEGADQNSARKPELAFSTVDELWTELSSRYASAIVLYERESEERGSWEYGLMYHGSLPSLLGLCEYGSIRIRVALRRPESWNHDDNK